jgi:hypothetical protein
MKSKRKYQTTLKKTVQGIKTQKGEGRKELGQATFNDEPFCSLVDF